MLLGRLSTNSMVRATKAREELYNSLVPIHRFHPVGRSVDAGSAGGRQDSGRTVGLHCSEGLAARSFDNPVSDSALPVRDV